MKNTILAILVIAASFCCGFAVKSLTTTEHAVGSRRVTGIGGIFFKCKDPKKVTEWYKTHLGFNTNDYGATFEWYEGTDTTKKGQTQWTPFDEKTSYFNPSAKDFMIDYRVENMLELVKQLKAEGVTVLDTIETYDYGKFVHILDIEGDKVQLWEPVAE